MGISKKSAITPSWVKRFTSWMTAPKKISLADLDVPATVKANDDRGMEFKVPAQKPAPKKSRY